MKIPLLALSAGIAALCSADELTLADGTVLHEAQVLRHDDESATIRHSTGVQRIPYQKLSRELQEQLGLTPEDVAARREKARQTEKKRADAREKKAALQRAALETSGLSPRYMSGADVIALYSTWGTLSAAAAEYLAAEWNRREALRCGLTVEAARYKADAAELAKHVEQERADSQQNQEKLANLQEQLQETRKELQQTQQKTHKLEKQNEALKNRPENRSSTTVVVTEPRYVPVPTPVVVPSVQPPRPAPPVVRPAPHVQPFRPGARPTQGIIRMNR